MTTELTRSSNLPAEVITEIQLLTTSPAKYLDTLPIEKADGTRPTSAITIGRMHRALSREQQLMYLSLLIKDLNDFFNVKGNMSAKQIRMTADLILSYEHFFDLTLGNIKACFQHKMMTEKLYDRLDGNLIIGWLRGFKARMAEAVYEQRLEDDKKLNTENNGGLCFYEYKNMLEMKARQGNPNDVEALKRFREWADSFKFDKKKKAQSREKELAFFKYKQEYLKNKKGKPTTP